MQNRAYTQGILICGVVLQSLALGGCAWVGVPTVLGCWPQPTHSTPWLATPLIQRLIVIGDFGANYEDRNVLLAQALQRLLAAAPEARAVTHVVLLGDNFYPRGLVGTNGRCDPTEANSAAIAQQLEAVLEPFAFLRDMHIPITAIPGNHDHGCGSLGLKNQENPDRFVPPHQQWRSLWNFHSGQPRAVTFAPARLQLLLLDSEPMLQDRKFLQASTQGLKQLIQEGLGRYQWQLVAAHHPLRTFGEHDGAFPGGIRKPLTFLFFPLHFLAAAGLPPFSALSQDAYSFRYQRYRRAIERVWRSYPGAVDLFLAGHDHSLQLLEPREQGFPFELIVGSGAYCSPVRQDPALRFAAAKHGFAVLDFTIDSLTITLYATSECTEKRICPVGTNEAYVLHQTRFHRQNTGKQGLPEALLTDGGGRRDEP